MDGAQPVFYYDLGNPWCYLVAETVMTALPAIPEWEPVLGSKFEQEMFDRTVIERLAAARGLQPLRWPTSWPADSEKAMLAATYAKRIGRAVAFSLAAFRQTFAGGRDLQDENTILIAGAACEMHPAALRKAIELASTRNALEEATRRARQAGVMRTPAIQIGQRTYQGPDAIAEATAAGTR